MMHNFFAAALLLIIAIHFGDCDECGSLVLNGTSGDFGLQNPSEQGSCVWTITNANSYITITYLDILDEDTLKVYDGVQESETLVKTIRKGDKVPLVIGCAAANSTIEFVVGSQGGSGGFNGTYNTDVGQIYSEEWTDFVHAPFYLTKSGNMTVEYHLTSEKEDGRLSLTFDQLQVADFTMAVYNGPVVNSTKLIDSFNSSTSTSVPNDVITEDRALTVQITFSTAKVQNLTMSYLTLSNNNADCSGTYALTNTSMAHTITSPGFPGPYVTNTWCRWLITAPEHTTIRVNINDLQLQPANDFVRLVDGGSRYGRSIMWFGANATDEAKHGLYLTSSNNLWMEFFSDQSLVDGLFNISITMQAFSKTVVSPTLIDVLEISSATIPAAVSVIEDVIYYRLIAEQDKQVQISANTSAMRLLGGTVDFYEGSEESDDALITTWRTDNYYSDVLSNSNVMLVVARKFVNDGKLTNQTLKASVVYVSKDVGSVTSVGEDGNYELQKPAQHEPTEWNIINKDSINSARLLTIGGMKLCTDCSIKVYNSSHATNDTLIYTWDETTTLQPNTLIYSTEFKLIITTPAPSSNSDSDVLASLLASFSTVPTCAQTIAGDSSGTVTSMNYPDRFPANAQCLWTFNTTSVTNVNLRLAFDHAQFSNDAALSFHQHGHAGYPNTTTHIDGSSSIPDDIIVSANATLTQSIVLNFTSPINAITPSIGDGFSLRYYYSNCGGSVVDVTEAITSPGYPASINTTVHCVWLVTVEPTDPQHNSTINTIKLSLDMKAPNNFTTLSMHDGGNVHAPIIYANQTQTTNNKLWIEYKTEVEAGSKHVGAPFSLALSKLACQKSQQCDNGRCMLDGWKCNGNNDCGDYSDEKDCGGSSTKKSGVSAGMVVLAIFITIIITVVLTIAAPIAYRRWRSSRMPYGTLHEPVSIDA